ncbi:MAG: tetratricopeptide repeat protein [Thiohalospira sp.]
MYIKKLIILFLILSGILNTYGQNKSKADSLETLLENISEEKSIQIINQLSEAYLSTDINKSLIYGGKALELSEKYDDEEASANAHLNIANAYYEMSRYQPAIEYYEKALEFFYEQKSPDTKIFIYNRLGHSEKNLSNYNNALFYYQKPLNLYLLEKDQKISKAYNYIGAVYRLMGNYQQALTYHQRALSESNLSFDQSEISNTLNYMGSLYWNISQYDSSLFFYEKALDIKENINDEKGQAVILNNIGIVFKDRGIFQKALEYHQQALTINIKINIKKEIANTYNNIGNVYLQINNIDNALKFYNLSLDLRESIDDIAGIAQSQKNIALVYQNNNDNQLALDFMKKSLSNYQKVGNKTLIANCLNQMGNVYRKINVLDQALETYLNALKIRQEVGNNSQIAASLNNIGIIYDEINNYKKALDFYTQSLELKNELGDNKDIAYAHHIIGNTYLNLNQYTKALENYIRALELREKIDDKIGIATSLKSLGNVYLKLNDLEKSLIYLNEALKIREEIGDMKGVSDVLNDLGNYYFTTNNYLKAADYFKQTIDITEKTGDQYLNALCSRKLGEIYLSQGYDIEGFELIEKSLTIGQLIDNFELIKNAYYSLYYYYDKRGDKTRALDYFINYSVIKDSIIARNNSQKILEIQMNYELGKSQSEILRIEEEISELTAEKTIRELELKRQKYARNLSILITLITLISGLIILIQFLLKRKTNILLQEKIKEVDQSNQRLKESEENLKILNATKDKFFSIIAHDIRNPFNAVYGLTEHLAKNFDQFSKDELKTPIELIHQSADDLLELLDNLLHWSRAQRGKLEFVPREVNLHDIVNKNINLLKINAEKKAIEIISEIKPKEEIIADYDMLMAIFRNLISNAIKFSYKNSKVYIKSEDSNNEKVISVIDQGIGITSENIKKLFRIDIHYSTTGTSEEQGSGLGLILCREFVEKHGGKIWVESEENKGSTFKFTIPKEQ